ncbi:sugar phosphorylase [Bacteroidales bacterium]|nr:sugar phosphorylase [Bacteroidales bacterium]
MKIEASFKEKIESRLKFVYKDEYNPQTLEKLLLLLKSFNDQETSKVEKWNEQDSILITYGDSILPKDDKTSLQTLTGFLNEKLKGLISTVHILPFFPYSSDDGFSVIDFKQVNPDLGDWSDVKTLTESFDLMVDLVVNHISQKSEWYQQYLKGEEPGKNYFIEASPATDLSNVVRPRSLPLLTPANTPNGEKHVWTTFSADQIDLNFANQDLLVEMIDILLLYLNNNARIIRLDAIAFLWKEIGTTCLHLRETHEVVKLMRDVLEYIEPKIVVLTETNVPNKENLSYFGNHDEAHMVYQFSLPPLLLYAMYFGDSTFLTKWALSLPKLQSDETFFNFTASHDGVGVRPLEGLVPNDGLMKLVEGMRNNGGFVNTKANKDGSHSPYELNITYFDACSSSETGETSFQKKRFLSTQTIMMGMKGVPAFYIHSLLATPNYHEGVKETGMNRTINRRKYNISEIDAVFENNESLQQAIFNELVRRIKIRKEHKAFHPNADQKILDINQSLFVFARGGNDEMIICVSNVTEKEISVALNDLGVTKNDMTDLISGDAIDEKIVLSPYQTVWLK